MLSVLFFVTFVYVLFVCVQKLIYLDHVVSFQLQRQYDRESLGVFHWVSNQPQPNVNVHEHQLVIQTQGCIK